MREGSPRRDIDGMPFGAAEGIALWIRRAVLAAACASSSSAAPEPTSRPAAVSPSAEYKYTRVHAGDWGDVRKGSCPGHRTLILTHEAACNPGSSTRTRGRGERSTRTLITKAYAPDPRYTARRNERHARGLRGLGSGDY